MENQYKEGDLVKHTAKFLKSIGWFSGVPINGRVESVEAEPGFYGVSACYLTVKWSDGNTNRIRASNVMPYDRPDTSAM